ncbi:MAG: right-handed parallel beta-helix repeat-containing protein [Desulfosalsimonadaceae bacterium]
MRPNWAIKGYSYGFKSRSPVPSDTGYPLNYVWIDRSANLAYILSDLSDGIAAWSFRPPDSIINDGTIGQVNIIGDSSLNDIVSVPGPPETDVVFPIVNVQSSPYNAKGDGITDDYPSIFAALESLKLTGGTLYLPAGHYKQGSPIFVDSTWLKPIVYKGAARGLTIIETTFTTVNAAIRHWPGAPDNPQFRDFTLKGSLAPEDYGVAIWAQNGINVQEVDGLIIDNIEVYNFGGDCFGATGLTNFSITRSYLHDSGGEGCLLCILCNKGVFAQNILGGTRQGLDINGYDITVTGNVFGKMLQHSAITIEKWVEAWNTGNIVISGNIFDVHDFGITTNSAAVDSPIRLKNVSIINNIFHNSGATTDNWGTAIGLAEAQNFKISGNFIENCKTNLVYTEGYGTGIWIDRSCDDIDISGNMISNCVRSGITVGTYGTPYSINNISIKNNTLDTVQAGIIFRDTLTGGEINGNTIKNSYYGYILDGVAPVNVIWGINYFDNITVDVYGSSLPTTGQFFHRTKDGWLSLINFSPAARLHTTSLAVGIVVAGENPFVLTSEHHTVLFNVTDGPDWGTLVPDANTCPGRVYALKHIGSGGLISATVGGSGGTIDGSSPYTISALGSVIIQSAGVNNSWFVIGKN